MIPAEFSYLRATSVDDAVGALHDDAKVLAGGQSLIPLLRLRLAYPELLVDVTRVAEMHGVRDDGDRLVIGAATTHDDLMRDPLVQAHCPVLATVTSTVADPAVRHRGTFGGSLAHGDPAGDLPAAALALDAVMTVHGPDGRHDVPAAEFFVDFLETALGSDEVLLSVSVPKLDASWRYAYEKFNRTAQAWAVVGVLALVQRSNSAIDAARVALVNMGSTPLRAHDVESALVGATSGDDVRAAAQSAASGASPASDIHGSSDYRAHLASVLTRRAVSAAAGI
jgi:carbon-monoxide dehydrogenase medium subunit